MKILYSRMPVCHESMCSSKASHTASSHVNSGRKKPYYTATPILNHYLGIAKKHCHITSKRAHTVTLEEFRNDVRQTCGSSDAFIVVSFSRKVLGQTGDGHFSPIGAYNAERDAVLVLDVAR